MDWSCSTVDNLQDIKSWWSLKNTVISAFHIAQRVAQTPTRIWAFNFWWMPPNQFRNGFEILVGGAKSYETWTVRQISVVNRHDKNKWWIGSSWSQEQYFVMPCQFRVAMLSLVPPSAKIRWKLWSWKEPLFSKYVSYETSGPYWSHT